MIDPRRAQLSFGDKLIAEEVEGLYEEWMVHADEVLADEAIVMAAYKALCKRRRLSRTRGRRGFSAEAVVRLLILKHARNWSYAVLEREVRANLIYRKFTRIGFAKAPDAKTMGKWGVAVGPEVIKEIHERIVNIAKEKDIAQGAKMRVDTTVVETNVHYPTDSSLLGDGVRVLTRVMKKIATITGEVGCKLRDRSRSVKHRVMEIGRAARAKGAQGKEKLHKAYADLLNSTSRVVGQAKCFAQEILDGTKRATSAAGQVALECFKGEIEQMVPRVQQVIAQTKARIFHGETRTEAKIFSLFEPSTENIRKGKAGKPNEFGKLIKLQEAENQIIINFEVYDKRPSDTDLLIPAIETHEAVLGRTPRLVAADAGFYSANNEAAAKAKGVKRVSIPNRSTKSLERKRVQKKRWFRNGQKWRTGCEGRISVIKRRHGLSRCRYKGDAGMKRWVGLGVIADNLISMGNAIARQAKQANPSGP
ncbi:MAG TPA: ISNCY family transposase [Methyloceanibacter sp.]|nr:ISNCY family transposase [Methyloceanibacter sp.]